jgi:hypothetical protein
MNNVTFRQQVSEYDCVPTSLVNALSYLFHRRDIPPFVIQRVYKDCLDGEAARGTTSRAIQELGFWLSCYREKRFKAFAIESKFISGKQVHFRRNSRIIRCLDSQGVALLCVHSSRNSWHYILCLQSEGGWLHCFDPKPHTKRFIKNDAVQFIATADQQKPNARIRFDWLEKEFDQAQHPDERKYVLGDIDDRECLLLNRIRV